MQKFAQRFPKFKELLRQQFPDDWIDNTENEDTDIEKQTQELFQFSQFQRNEREKLIHQIHR